MTLRVRAVGRFGVYALGLLGGVGMLGIAAGRAGSRSEPVRVHVLESDVRVEVGGHSFDVKGRRDDPIECDLPPGEYRLTMTREREILCDYTFEVLAGYDSVLTAARVERTSRR